MLQQSSHNLIYANSPIVSEFLELSVFLDGYVSVYHYLWINQTYPSINVSLIGESQRDMLAFDEQHLPLDFLIVEGKAIINTLGASELGLFYFTPDLTLKTGKYWTLKTEVQVASKISLPEGATIISINRIPDSIESLDNQVLMIMPAGIIEITYIAEHNLQVQQQETQPWFLIAGIALSAVFVFSVLWLLMQRKLRKTRKPDTGVDLKKLLDKERNLRPEEIQVIHFLAEKNGTAFEVELYEKLDLPRTTTWRLLRRLEKMEIVDIRKSRRQNIISIRKKYLKKDS